MRPFIIFPLVSIVIIIGILIMIIIRRNQQRSNMRSQNCVTATYTVPGAESVVVYPYNSYQPQGPPYPQTFQSPYPNQPPAYYPPPPPAYSPPKAPGQF
ncbi:unnamed protein product [Bursaphelenchus xylophilus]|uniref:(pine wood nematode) hypothetical protein n=1 Tax=Bursaphelenchus xylophilus TaxID=6326 RepID=A0A811M2H6_BURXY|nr:unnamed protein product [Bursaphelenchus xylophilus]CAG9126661.1 unnamed protein product [Bursaphelenchus xylophilus]